MIQRPLEAALYPAIQNWMERHFRCFETASNVGLQHSRADVFGVRDVGGAMSGEIQTICIEVKRGTEPFATASGQARGYAIYANKAYLADLRAGEFTSTEIDIASHLGIGLILVQSRPKKRGYECTEILSSPTHAPMPRMASELLYKLGLVECRLCGSVFAAGDRKNPLSRTVRKDIRRAIRKGKSLVYWLDELSHRKAKAGVARGDRGYEDKYTFEKRFLCRECLQAFVGPFAP